MVAGRFDIYVAREVLVPHVMDYAAFLILSFEPS